MMNSIFALLAEARDVDDPLLHREIRFLERYEIEDERGRTIRVQPCISPVWDTAIAMVSLEEAGLDPSHPALVAAERWVLEESDSRPWRLAGEEQASCAGRLGFRVSERLLSRCGRHRIRPDGAWPRRRS